MNRPPRPVLVIAVLLGAGCGDSTGPSPIALAVNHAKWLEHGPDAYTFEYHRVCGECLPEWVVPVRISVEHGVVIAVVLAATGEPVAPPAFRLTMDSLFAMLERTIDRNPYRFTATYDSELGYPTSAAVDEDKMMVDDEWGFDARLVEYDLSVQARGLRE